MNTAPQKLLAWLGPAISQRAFEVGDDVRDAFVAQHAQAIEAFLPGANGKWMADIYLLAHQRLHALGVTRIYGGEYCTYSDPARFFSYRRDGLSGRMGTFIWLE
jgi:copper oxidase (laccase) domain-containing protein